MPVIPAVIPNNSFGVNPRIGEEFSASKTMYRLRIFPIQIPRPSDCKAVKRKDNLMLLLCIFRAIEDQKVCSHSRAESSSEKTRIL